MFPGGFSLRGSLLSALPLSWLPGRNVVLCEVLFGLLHGVVCGVVCWVVCGVLVGGVLVGGGGGASCCTTRRIYSRIKGALCGFWADEGCAVITRWECG